MVVGLKMGPLSGPVVTSYRLSIVTIGLSLTVCAVLRLNTDRRTNGRTDGIGLAKAAILSAAKKWNFALLESSVVNNGQRSDFVGRNFLYFPFNANLSNAAAVAGDSDDSDVVARW